MAASTPGSGIAHQVHFSTPLTQAAPPPPATQVVPPAAHQPAELPALAHVHAQPAQQALPVQQ
eukprot:7787090-Prorocentrum_lima.AAC.1